MNKCVLFCLALFCGLLVEIKSQPRPVSPRSSIIKPNKRPTTTHTPKPTPPVPEDGDAAADDNIGEVILVNTNLVTIPVRILDRKNRFIGGLAKENFKVFEDGVEQEIDYFTNEAQPFTVALVLDMSYSATFKIDEIQGAALAFIDQLRPHDQVMVISFDEEVHMLCDATSDRKRIYEAIRSTRISTGTSLYEAVDLSMNERLRNIEGRKAIVLFTDGVDTTSRSSGDLENLRDASELDALIYPIRYDTFADVQSLKNQPIVNLPGSVPKSAPPTASQNKPLPFPVSIVRMPGDKGTTAEEYTHAEQYLGQLAFRTGGRIHVADTFGNLNAAFARIASELREFYSLGYYPKIEGKPGKTRRIKVRVDKENVVVRARDSYVVAKNKKFGKN